ncbi:hypothetical protein Acsp03_22870 [Actinomadura sp. NBRC 104412]|uniref:hypothetical protein n=1 Tax=Actinomadura sp. NBRC 104412 TaxID=3032203 RepID=UPI0024A5C42C|nr:hypothetical protein [Actinomadura sp. NBRC 104412]GLZ04821.1 hypothetical protein Acsp03_22870 [Actinomadura sp. NBRC 104412]
MQLPRVVIAAVFFAIGALIAIPAIWDQVSRADGSPAGSTTSPSPSPTSGSPTSPSPTRTTASPTRTASPSPTPTRTTTRPAVPVQPLQISIGSVRCPARTIEVTIRNTGPRAEDFAIERNDGTAATPGRIGAGQTRTVSLTLREDRRTTIQITLRNEPIRTRSVTANCRTASPTPTEEPTPSKSPDDQLPRTGPDDTVLWARAATGGAAMVTGAIIFWYGGIWPRRREHLFGGTKKS